MYFCFIDYAKAFDCVNHNKLWKILKENGIPDHLTCLLRNLYAGQEATVRTGHGEKEMATHSSILAWKIPWTEEPGRLQSMGSPKKKKKELDMEQQTGSTQEKEYAKAVYCHPAYLTSMQSTS